MCASPYVCVVYVEAHAWDDALLLLRIELHIRRRPQELDMIIIAYKKHIFRATVNVD